MNPPQPVEEALDELRRVRSELAQLVGIRDRAIRAAHTGGASLRTIGGAVGLSKDAVRTIVRQQ